MPNICDNTSVGVLIRDGYGNYLLFDRNTYPPGAAPPAGHRDSHGSFEDAARAEVAEESGLIVVGLEEVTGGWRHNRCRRTPGPLGPGHEWRVYAATVIGDLKPSPRETRNARWLNRYDLSALAARTMEYAYGAVTAEEFATKPGLEPVWARWLADVGLIALAGDSDEAIDLLAAGAGPR